MLDAKAQFLDRLAADEGLTGDPSASLRVASLAHMLQREAGEVEDCTPWKRHKRDYGRDMTAAELEHAREETIDCLHLVLGLCIRLGLTTSQAVTAEYARKDVINHTRQDSGY